MSSSLFSSMLVCPDSNLTYPKIERGDGIYLFDEEGLKYIDASGGAAAATNIGHGNIDLAGIIKQQVEKVCLLPTHYFSSSILEEYLQKLSKFAPSGFNKAWTVSSGTEAVENAMKVALQFHQINGEPSRYKIIGRWSSYHGNSILTLDVGGMRLRRSAYLNLLKNHPHVSPAYCYRCPFDLERNSCRLHCAQSLEQTIVSEDPSTIAAFIVEPVVGAALGAVPSPDGYLEVVHEICKKYGILLIIDEVMTGFGRTGKNFGFQHSNITPDIIAVGKGIAAGYYPLSAIIIHERISQVFSASNIPFLGGHTYACNPLGAAIGKFVLDYIIDNNLVDRSRVMGAFLLEKLAQLYVFSCVGNVRGCGLLVGIEFVKDVQTKEPFAAEVTFSRRIGIAALKRGVILYPGRGGYDGVMGDHILIAPPLIIDEQAIEIIVSVIRESIIEVLRDISTS